jgi:PKD repeat protein
LEVETNKQNPTYTFTEMKDYKISLLVSNEVGADKTQVTITVPTYSFYDTFTGTSDLASHTPEIGGAWTVVSGIPSVDNGYLTLERTSDIDRRVVIINDMGIADAIMVFDMSFTPNFESGMTLEFNRLDDSNHWAVYHSPPYLWIFEHTAGVQTTRATYIGTYGYTTMSLKIITNGDTIDVYKNDVLIMTYTVANRSHKTYSGLRIDWFKNSGTVQFDKISAA